jgi:alpha-acetolactate decarboxylase
MRIKRWLINLTVLTFILVSGCMENSSELSEKENSNENLISTSVPENDIFYQVSIIDALLQGVYDGTLSVGELKTHGNFGIGTLDGLDGEMLALDGNYYQVKTDGIAYPVSEKITTPFATVTNFETDENLPLKKPMNMTELEQYLDLNLPSENFFYAVKIDGNFSYLKARSVPKQERPYRKLADAVSNQTIFEFENVSGTLVGFRTPDYVQGINVPGYHLHFITANRSAGGHVLEFELENGTAALDTTTAFFMELPTSDSFSKVELGQDLNAEMQTVEK